MKRPLKTRSHLTQKRILESARTLFGRHGTSHIHTHDIAEDAGLSPGNLYYHFKNKEEIIRSLFLEMPIFQEESWSAYFQSEQADSFVEFTEFVLGNLLEGHFLFAELNSLLHQDAKLRELWRTRHQSLRQAMRKAAETWVRQGFMKAFAGPEALNSFLDLAWVILTQTSTSLKALSSSSAKLKPKNEIEFQATLLFLDFLKPYHTAKGLKELDRYQKSLQSRHSTKSLKAKGKAS